jgi:hypothetical protein
LIGLQNLHNISFERNSEQNTLYLPFYAVLIDAVLIDFSAFNARICIRAGHQQHKVGEYARQGMGGV